MIKQKLQWHPAFIATMQIDFAEEAEQLTFLSEFELNKMPLRIDALVIKKNPLVSLKNDIGHILRGHNIFEYKSPADNLTIDDFYKVYGYACFYKSYTEQTNTISQEDITISYVCSRYPSKMLNELQTFRKLYVYKVGPGLYYINGDSFPIQLIITRELDPETHCWLSSLRTDLVPDQHLDRLLKDYEQHEDSNLYKAALDLIVRANPIAMEEARTMCEALRELFAEDLEKATKEEMKKITEELTKEVSEKVTKEVSEKVTKEVSEKVTKEVSEEVTKEVTYQNILLLIDILLEDGYSTSAIAQKLQLKYQLTQETSMDYIMKVQEKYK